MSPTHKLLLLAMLAGALAAACKDDPIEIPEPSPQQASHTVIIDTTGLVITDSLTVSFGEKRWATIDYTARIDTVAATDGQRQEWVTVEAHHPDSLLPSLRLLITNQLGAHTSTLGVADPGLGYTLPGEMYRNNTGGDLFYCDSLEIRQPDGTLWSDWRPLELTTTVLNYDAYYRTLTATATALMFHYGQWLDSATTAHPINVADADTCRITITFGNLKIN